MMIQRKQLLILKASNDVCEAEINHIEATAKLYNIEITKLDVLSYSHLESDLRQIDKKFDYFYLCAHANESVFGDNDLYGFQMHWLDFGGILCYTDSINYGCIFLLACCRTGLNQVAYDLLYSCAKIDFICGPHWKLTPNALTVAFEVFIYNMEERHEQPNVAAERMSQAVGYQFAFYDRLLVESKPDYIARFEMNKQRLNEKWEKEIHNTPKEVKTLLQESNSIN